MDPFGGNASWWAANQPINPELNYHQASLSSQTWQLVEGDVQHFQQMLQQPGNSLYLIPVQVQMPYGQASQDQDKIQLAQVQQVLEVPFQVQQAAQQKSPSIQSLSNGESSIDMDASGGSSSRWAADPSSHPDQLALSQSSQPSPWVEGDVQHPDRSSCPMPVDDCDLVQLVDEFLEACNDNRSYPPTNESKPDRIPFPDGGHSSDLGYNTTYQQPLQPSPAQFEDIESRLAAGMTDGNEMGVDQENSGVYSQPDDTNSAQKLPDSWSTFHESILLSMGESNDQPLIKPAVLPNPPNSQIQYEQTNKAPEVKTSVHKANADILRAYRSKAVGSSAYKCPKCDLFFRSQRGLTQHQRWVHSDRKFLCKRCNMPFPSQNTLNKHIAVHDMPHKPFKCTECPKEFCRKGELRRHMYSHSDSTPYVCNVCSRRCIRNDRLLEHQRQHENSKKITTQKPKKKAKALTGDESLTKVN